PETRSATEAGGRAEVPWIDGPGTAAEDTATAVSACPSRAVRRRAGTIVVIAVLGPLPCIALHVAEAEGVRRKAADWRRISIAIIAGRNRPIAGTRYRALRHLICV